jgi:hypothetical protein
MCDTGGPSGRGGLAAARRLASRYASNRAQAEPLLRLAIDAAALATLLLRQPADRPGPAMQR